MRQRIALT